jgi:plastocyanin
MDIFDSRSLRYIDCFAQKFSSAGKIKYRLTTTAGACLPIDEDIFTIDVVKPKNDEKLSEQHNIIVRREEQRFVADPPHLKIEAGDTVLWNSPDPSAPGFVVRGKGADGIFDSSALTSEAVYTHAFGMPGDYEWVDANGKNVRGVIHVRSLDPNNRDECKKWMNSLKNGTLIMINENEVQPDCIEILTGQTVFWAVQKAAGISITDARLVRKDPLKYSQKNFKC